MPALMMSQPVHWISTSLSWPNLAVVDALEDLGAVVGDEEAMGYGHGQVSGADELQDLAANGKVVGQRFFDKDAFERKLQGGLGHFQVGGRPGGDADDVGGAGRE